MVNVTEHTLAYSNQGRMVTTVNILGHLFKIVISVATGLVANLQMLELNFALHAFKKSDHCGASQHTWL